MYKRTQDFLGWFLWLVNGKLLVTPTHELNSRHLNKSDGVQMYKWRRVTGKLSHPLFTSPGTFNSPLPIFFFPFLRIPQCMGDRIRYPTFPLFGSAVDLIFHWWISRVRLFVFIKSNLDIESRDRINVCLDI